jgi:C-terminal peptidase prc
METVRKGHLQPCRRADMIVAGVKAVRKEIKADLPADLDRRAAALESPQQFAAFLRELWPDAEVARKYPRGHLENVLVSGVLDSIPGRPSLIPDKEIAVRDQISGNRYVGIGIQIGIHNTEKVPVIVSPIRRGPAHVAGLKADDLILEVDGQSTRDEPLQKVLDRLRGLEGSQLTVVVRQPGGEPRTYKLTRSVIPFESVLGFRRAGEDGWDYRPDPKEPIGYLWVPAVRSSTLHELRQAEQRLRAEGARALVLDLRFSHGDGLLHHAVLLADGLLDSGVLFRHCDKSGQVKEYKADRECLFRGWPLAVLVNGSIADNCQGAVLAALQDNGRAVLVGEATKCDGFVNSMVRLPAVHQGAVVFRTGRLERVAKERGWPVQPDHVVPLTKEQEKAVHQWMSLKQRVPQPPAADLEPPTDPQLARAVELLRAALLKAD